MLKIYGIFIFPEFRQKGYCRFILEYLIEKCKNKFKYICIESVISNILYSYLQRFSYNNKKFLLKKEGFFCKIY